MLTVVLMNRECKIYKISLRNWKRSGPFYYFHPCFYALVYTGLLQMYLHIATPSGQSSQLPCLKVGGFDVGGRFWGPIIPQHRGIPVLAFCDFKHSLLYRS